MGDDRTFRTLVVMALGAAATFMCLEIGWLAHGLRLELVPHAEAVVQQASTTLDHSNEALTVQEDLWAQQLRETKKATADLHDLLIHTDINLNGRHGDGGILGGLHAAVIPDLDAVLRNTNLAAARMAGNIDLVGDSTARVVAKVGPLVDGLTAQVKDPAIGDAIANLDKSAVNVASATSDAAATMADVRKGVDYEVKQLTAPETKFAVFWHFFIRSVGRFFGY